MGYPAARIATTLPVRTLTPNAWRNALEAFADGGPSPNSFYFEDFKTTRVNTTDASAELDWFIQDAAAGGTAESFISSASPDGLAVLSATTGTDHFGIEAHHGASATTQGRVVLNTHPTAGRGKVIFETYINVDDSDTFFLGLTEPIVEFLSATSTLPTTSDYIGFYRLDDGVLQFVCANDNNGGTAVVDTVTVLAAAAVPTGLTKYCFVVNADDSVEIYVDDVRYKTEGDSIDPLALPIERLTEKICLLRGATADLATVSATIDYVASLVSE